MALDVERRERRRASSPASWGWPRWRSPRASSGSPTRTWSARSGSCPCERGFDPRDLRCSRSAAPAACTRARSPATLDIAHRHRAEARGRALGARHAAGGRDAGLFATVLPRDRRARRDGSARAVRAAGRERACEDLQREGFAGERIVTRSCRSTSVTSASRTRSPLPFSPRYRDRVRCVSMHGCTAMPNPRASDRGGQHPSEGDGHHAKPALPRASESESHRTPSAICTSHRVWFDGRALTASSTAGRNWRRAPLPPDPRSSPAARRRRWCRLDSVSASTSSVTSSPSARRRAARRRSRECRGDASRMSGPRHQTPIEFEVFKNLFVSVAEEMGVTLCRTGFSPNIKERLDYSCAVYDRRGRRRSRRAITCPSISARCRSRCGRRSTTVRWSPATSSCSTIRSAAGRTCRTSRWCRRCFSARRRGDPRSTWPIARTTPTSAA